MQSPAASQPKRFRLERTTEDLIAQFKALDEDPNNLPRLVTTDGGCSESCEVYDTVEVRDE